MSQNKTTRNDGDVTVFLDAVTDPRRRADAHRARRLMADVTGASAAMWGTAIVGFGAYRYEYASGRSGESAAVGFSPRKANLTLYFPGGFDADAERLRELGPHTIGKSCLYIKRLDDIDEQVLRDLVDRSYRAFDGTMVTP